MTLFKKKALENWLTFSIDSKLWKKIIIFILQNYFALFIILILQIILQIKIIQGRSQVCRNKCPKQAWPLNTGSKNKFNLLIKYTNWICN